MKVEVHHYLWQIPSELDGSLFEHGIGTIARVSRHEYALEWPLLFTLCEGWDQWDSGDDQTDGVEGRGATGSACGASTRSRCDASPCDKRD